jgi:hypothetical protein
MTLGGEEAAEMIATIRGEHVAMKKWFAEAPESAELKRKYGDYPSMWKEVLNWKGWKEARKAFMVYQQTGGSAAASGVPRIVPAEEVPRKRKSRWGSVDEKPQEQHEQQGGGPPPARRSRWSSSSAPPPPPPPPAGRDTCNQNGGGGGSSYGQYGNGGPPNNHNRGGNNNAPALPGLPGMPANLAPHQQRELTQLQSRLRQINDRLQSVDREASRVDALPRGHRERSPSPPPGTYFVSF